MCRRRKARHGSLELRSRPWSLALVVLTLAFLAGCQGLSSANSSNSQQNGNSNPPGVLTPSPASFNFGSVQLGDTKTLPESVANTGSTSLTVSQVSVTGAGFSISGVNLPLTVDPGQRTSFSVSFDPTAAGSSSGNIAFTIAGETAKVNVGLSGDGVTPGTLTANPASFNFGNVQVGSHQSQWENLKNTGGSNLTISQANVSGTGFSISGFAPPVTLTPGQIYTFSVIFTPPGAGTDNGSLSLTSDASNPTLTVPLTGTGTTLSGGQLAVSPASLDFGNVIVGTNGVQNGTLSASGASVTVASVTVNSNEFKVSGLNFPVTIPAGQNAQFMVTFTPQATGVASATATFVSDASNSPTVQSLTGTGIAPPPHYVDLSWAASNSQGVIGYNIYRGTVSGGPYNKINTSLDPSTQYTDDSVVAGQIYYYVATAMNSSDQESGYSNQAKAVIPSP